MSSYGVPLLDEPRTYRAVARLSKATSTPRSWPDGGATAYLLGVPLLAAAAVAVADATGRAIGAVTAGAALVMLVWGLLLGLGYGAYFLLPALILVVAGLASVRPPRGGALRIKLRAHAKTRHQPIKPPG